MHDEIVSAGKKMNTCKMNIKKMFSAKKQHDKCAVIVKAYVPI